MTEIKKVKVTDENYRQNNFYHKFFVVENLTTTKNIDSVIELCIIETDFGKTEIEKIKQLKEKNKNTEFWISTNNPSRDNILIANKIGIKTVISSPFDKKLVEDFFKMNSNAFNVVENFENNYDYSTIAGANILIVDDNPMNVELLEEILSEFNLNISTFLKPKEALKIAMHEKFDLCLIDIMMPEMSGFELSNKIKQTSLNKNTPMIFISALSDAMTKIKGYNLGSCAYIEKPFDINIVKSQIFNLLKTHKEQQIENSANEDFLATVAHDLKTPINAEINALKLLLNNQLGDIDESQQEILQDILESTKFMQDMVENILCKNKIENGKMNLSKQIYSLKEIVEHCLDLTKYILSAKQQEIEFKCHATHTLLPLDFVEIKRAINNIIANASEYSPIKGKICISIYEKANKLFLDIEDFGKGIDIKKQHDVFSQYISYAKEYKKVGSGLGLYITKRIIEAHKGDIKLQSQLGVGTKITICFPLSVKD
jgi:two-component system, sensor histidine kinase and response regulator